MPIDYRFKPYIKILISDHLKVLKREENPTLTHLGWGCYCTVSCSLSQFKREKKKSQRQTGLSKTTTSKEAFLIVTFFFPQVRVNFLSDSPLKAALSPPLHWVTRWPFLGERKHGNVGLQNQGLPMRFLAFPRLCKIHTRTGRTLLSDKRKRRKARKNWKLQWKP